MASSDRQMNSTNHSTASTAGSGKKTKAPQQMATVSETFSFVWECGTRVKVIFAFGVLGGMVNGCVYPALAYLFSTSFSDISASATEGLTQVRELAYLFMAVGAFALVAGAVQNFCFELVAKHASHRLRLAWFKALLRQDAAWFDSHSVGGIAQSVGPNANKYQRGIGRKFGEGIQFLTTMIGGLGYAFWSSWRVAFVVLAVVPFVSAAAYMTAILNQTKGARASKAYKAAGSVSYSSVSAIRTVLSLNAIQEMIRQYKVATQEAFSHAVKVLIPQGFFNGAMLGSFLLLYAILTLYGTSLLYKDIEDTGCDPSDGVVGNDTCENSGPDVFGAMLGVAFAAQGASQCGTIAETFTAARVAVFEALRAINRQPGAPEEIIYKTEEDDDLGTTTRSGKSKGTNDVVEEGEKVIKAILPRYEIDSTSPAGLRPENIQGAISVQNVHFTYPTRPNDPVLRGMNVEIAAGQTVAFVGRSGSGKSTIMSLLERFYDPLQGAVKLDGVDLKDINVCHLRKSIGYVGQEPTLFATTIRGNIRYGNPDATDEEIEKAARLANAHNFITSFSDGYETQVGDKGSQLSGGQKQRIAIARVLVGEPKMLLLDEATSALDAESELVVQDALDNILQQKKVTTVIIAHRLSTIRNADVINVVHEGQVVESGNHSELMSKEDYYYRLVQKQEGNGGGDANSDSAPSSRVSSVENLAALDDAGNQSTHGHVAHIEFKNVTFAYPTRPKKVIFDDFSLKIAQGLTVALVGPSGGGKSTTVGLIERFYDPVEGFVEFMGHDVKSLNVGWFRDQIGYVGQEPTLFNDTVGRNIAYGFPGATPREIEEAAKQANAHDFIMQFPEGYDTPVGERGTQLSGGQKQRVAIARALVKRPGLLILDEATSALDNESEAVVQAAIDNLMQSREHTVILIAHRLSTIRNADKIAFIGEGKVLEFGSHDELVVRPHGRYKRLFESSQRNATIEGLLKKSVKKADSEEEEEKDVDWEAMIEEEEKKAFNNMRAMEMAKPDAMYMFIGAVGAVMAGGVFPLWGVLFAETMDLLFRRVEVCPIAGDGTIPYGFDSCELYWEYVAEDLRDSSFIISGWWVVLIVGCLVGNMMTFFGFGHASERLSRRIRDSAFTALLRQEVSFFDKRSVGSITSQLQDDAARLHAFSGDPVRSFIVAMASIITGITLSFFYMWQFALLAIGCVPVMGFATSIEMKQFLGEDEGDLDAAEGLNTPGGVIVETLLNIRTVSALTLEDRRFRQYEEALLKQSNRTLDAFMSGISGGLSQFIQQWVNALQMWFGGYLLFNFQEDYSFRDFLISNFAILFALFGLGAAFQDLADRKQAEASAGRIFHLLDRKSEIDSLSTEGKKLGEVNLSVYEPVSPTKVDKVSLPETESPSHKISLPETESPSREEVDV